MGIVFNIQHFSIKDGKGIRSVVFLKGCALRCKWCANPESQKRLPELAWTKSKCIGCKYCVEKLKEYECAFGEKGLEWNRKNGSIPDQKRIDHTCASTALHVIGQEMSAREVIDEVMRDVIFYNTSDGGMTISGGEPLMQADFTLELIEEAHKQGIKVTMESCGYGPKDKFIEIAKKLDFLYMDIKSLNDEKHIAYTGISNQSILENIKAVRDACPKLEICIRTPVIPRFNDEDEDILDIIHFIEKLPNTQLELLKYHRLGVSKYEALGREYEMGDLVLSEEKFKHFQNLQQQSHLFCG